MKTIYFFRHAKAKNFHQDESDFEREISNKGKKQIRTISSYLKLRGILPDLILSSCALRAQQTAIGLCDTLEYNGKIDYLNQLYRGSSSKDILDIIEIQDDRYDTLFVIGHHPDITELVNTLTDEHISKVPSMGVVAIKFNIDSWSKLEVKKGKVDFFIFPKQFQYYMPNQIKATLR
ncbi:MAG: histidine phosphatase [Epsilonproteobacteria bacterium]|nr:histidine phosphatase [Campylobacterota bacterium]